MVMYLIDQLIALINGKQEQRQMLNAVEQTDGLTRRSASCGMSPFLNVK